MDDDSQTFDGPEFGLRSHALLSPIVLDILKRGDDLSGVAFVLHLVTFI